MSDRTLRRFAWLVFSACVLLVAGVLLLAASNWSNLPASFKTWQPWSKVPLAVTLPLVGLAIINRHPRLSIGWLLELIGFVLSIEILALFYKAAAVHANAAVRLPLGIWADWVSQWAWAIPFLLPPTLFLLLFPDGHLLSARWRAVAWMAVVMIAGATIVGATEPRLPVDGSSATLQNPFPLPLPVNDAQETALQNAFNVLFVLIFLLSGASLVLRWRRAGLIQRQQIKWFAYAMGLYIVATSLDTIQGLLDPGATGTVGGFAADVAALFIPVALGIAILRYRLFDIDIVIKRTVVYGLLAGFITAVYVGLVVGVGTLVGSSGRANLVLSLVATAIVAVAFQPARQRAQHLADRLIYGKRATPYEVLSGFGERLAETESSEALLDRMTRVLAEGTGAERAEVWVKVGDQLHRASTWPLSSEISPPRAMQNGTLPALEATRVAAVIHGGEALGALTITKKRSDPLTPVEDKLVTDLAAQAGLVLRNVGLTQQLRQRLEQLQASRQRLVTAQDEERRRIERNLHDGAQQQLIALQLGLGLAQRQAEIDCHVLPSLQRLKQDADEALTNLRELARGIYPPLLAADGLGVALQAQARKSVVPVELRLEGITRQRPEIEAAVYFCCLEALQNVAKYAQASRADIMVATTDDSLRFEVADDGKGFDPTSVKRSSGLQNMEDRVEVLGGSLTVESAPGAGTRVIGSIPLV